MEPIESQSLPTAYFPTDELVKIQMKRDPINYKYTRSFGKLDKLFAYIGGLISSVVGFAGIFLGWYNKLEFEVEQMKYLYYFKKNKPFDTDSFNIFKALPYYFLSKLYSWGLGGLVPSSQYY